MKKLSGSITVVLAVLWLVSVGSAVGQDPAKVGPNIYKCIFENERVRVCEVKFKAGDSIAVHSHPDHFGYAMSAGKLRITPEGGAANEVEFKPGQVVWIPAESHSGTNIGTTEVRLLIVELKAPSALGSVEGAVMQMEREWAAAMIKGDTATLDRIVASDWVLTNPGGQMQTRADSMAELKSGALKFESSAAQDIAVRVFGDTAIATGRSVDKSTYKGKDVSGEYRWTDVFVKRDGRWQAVSTHVTKVSPE